MMKDKIKKLLRETFESKEDNFDELDNGFSVDIDKETIDNENFRKVLYTTPHNQLVIMSLKPNEDIGLETHSGNSQFIRIEKGTGEAIIGGKTYKLSDGISIIIPAGVEHNITNTGEDELKLYTVYSPPVHGKDDIDKDKPE